MHLDTSDGSSFTKSVESHTGRVAEAAHRHGNGSIGGEDGHEAERERDVFPCDDTHVQPLLNGTYEVNFC